jgi:hypothetical protein
MNTVPSYEITILCRGLNKTHPSTKTAGVAIVAVSKADSKPLETARPKGNSQ